MKKKSGIEVSLSVPGFPKAGDQQNSDD